MAKMKEYILEQEYKREQGLNADLFWEHEQHTVFEEGCSECAKKPFCEQCKKFIDKADGRFCSPECYIANDEEWAYDRSIGN